MSEKFMLVVKKKDEKLRQTYEEIRRLKNIIKVNEKF